MNISNCKVNPYCEKNMGQLPRNIKYKVKLNDYITFFTEDKLIVSLPSKLKNTRNMFHMRFENTSKNIQIKGQEKQIGIVNYLIGNDESKWIRNIPTYSKIKYEGVYDNIDLYYYINNDNLEYDFVLSKGANPEDISISFEGLDSIEIDEENNAVLSIGDVKASLLKPEVYQIIDNIKVNIDCEYVLDKNNRLNFLINEYEKEFELVLDPVLKLDYSTYIGGSYSDYAMGIAVDNEGCTYITGYSEGDYPVITGQITYGGGSVDSFVTKLSTDGSSLIYSTYIGGSNDDYSKSICIDNMGCAYITGITNSTNYPTTIGAYQEYYGGQEEAFVTKLNQSGTLLIYSTYLGANAYSSGNGIAVDSEGYAYITGTTQGIYPTSGAYQEKFGGNYDAFVTKLNTDGRYLIYSTYIGGSGNDGANAIVVDSKGCAHIAGYTSGNYPITKGVSQNLYGGGIFDGFVSKLSADGKSLIYSTYIGGSDVDIVNAIALDEYGCVYIAGHTESFNYPTKNAYKTRYNEMTDAFISKLNEDGRMLIYSTYIGANENNGIYSIVVDTDGYAYISGYIAGDVTVGKLSIDGSSLINYTKLASDGYTSYGRGIALDKNGNIYISGYTNNNYPVTQGSYQFSFGGNYDVFVSKLLNIEFDLLLNYNPSKVKLLDTITATLIFKNLSSINLDINIQFQELDTSLKFIPNSFIIQNISYPSYSIPPEIYLSNISPQKTIEIGLDLKYISENFLEQIPITIGVELYDNRADSTSFLDEQIKTFYVNTSVGPNYIPGCNKDLYNLEIDGRLQTTSSGTPIVYYKSGDSYLYIEPYGDRYIYKELLNPQNIVEYRIS